MKSTVPLVCHSMTSVAMLIVSCCVLAQSTNAQSGGSYNIRQSVIAGGGGVSASGSLRIEGTIGQNVAGTSQGARFVLVSGFWAGSPCTPPSITQQPLSQAKCVHDRVTFSIAATGDSLAFQWRKNSENILGANSDTLSLLDLKPDDAGSYDVVVTGACGSMTSEPANLAVNVANAPEITFLQNSLCPNSTGNQASGPSDAIAYSWSIENGVIISASNIRSITFTAGSSGDVVLKLTATNATGCAANNSLLLTLTSPPTTASAGPDQLVCSTTATLAGNVPVIGAGVWTLVSGAGTISNPDSPGSPVTGLGAGANTFRWSIRNDCGISTDEVTIIRDASPPQLTCPSNVTKLTASPGDAGVTVTFAAPAASDNCGIASVTCTPPSGSFFPRGATTVTCTAVDLANNQASCSFTVRVFDGGLQDDTNPSIVLLVNTTTGDYLFCCGETSYAGRGTITRKGSVFTLEHRAPDRRVLARIDAATHTGTATLQSASGVTICGITDRDTTNDACVCGGG
jgi:HYR domain-containing protein/PKD domain-containing protein